ncbi:hypothetical protein AAU57_01710 [Nonlabens sp. YIK11]|uniref:hypothetical protein n=1 Tax=Nonlabens sp. YIK11 TaxID=1453349 RepID=UPI0006DC9F83|nr:hypothetical protein [Nonlabens sp. YIK11]KQC32177.1 hypothetical protein AAU57_01710 [Nonlabens sp. YIK11]
MNVLLQHFLFLVRFRESELQIYLQYGIVILLLIAAVVWLFRKKLFPSRYNSNNCGDGDCGCH